MDACEGPEGGWLVMEGDPWGEGEGGPWGRGGGLGLGIWSYIVNVGE